MYTTDVQHIIFFQGAIPSSAIVELLQSASPGNRTGANSIFLGRVRADLIGKETVSSIFYTAYEQMVLEKMQEINKTIHEKYPITYLKVYQSLGYVAVEEICLTVFAASAHRKAAIEACNETVELVKSELPIWGKEQFAGSGHHWKINKER
ncbi:MAG TPA: molybdenum cofactor biosynthesis protein MoaE [Chitinophagaceae bacterium]|jgi:molybdopterin synthase catalytic subunit|nr:molybdenum cofactor biosynthesis protein MoaE [Chitinophagaceae bacterium]